jgi:hypothetical protein
MVRARRRLSLLVLLAACGPARPPAPVVRLGAPTDSVAVVHAEVTSAAWLGGDRWAILAPGDNAVDLVDFARGRATPLKLAGGAELANPFAVFASGDTLYVSDWGKRRVSLWRADGRFLGAIPASDALRGALPRDRDAAGRFYLQINPRPGPDGSGNRDSAAVVRASPDLARADTIARLAPLDVAEVSGENGRRFERRIFSGEDRWGVLADGRFWVARVYQNQVNLRGPDGRWRKGEPLPDRVLEVTRYDREMFLRRFPKELRGTAGQLPFAPVKPAFENGFDDGTAIWLERSRAPRDSVRSYLVVNGDGALVREVLLPGTGRILAVHGATALAATSAPDGTHLLRYTIP